MRTALSILLAALAGLLAALSLVGARAEALVHTPGPLQQIAGPMSEDPDLREALPQELGTLVQEQLPDGLPGFLQDSAAQLVQGAADGLVTDERFPAAWSQVLEETRTEWVNRLETIHEGGSAEGTADSVASGTSGVPSSGTPAPGAGTLHLQLAPLVSLGVELLADSLEPLPGGAAAGEAIRAGAGDLSAGELTADDGSALLAVDLGFPEPDVVSAGHVATAVAWLPQWPWVAGAAAVSALLGLLLAPRERGWTVLLAAGITLVLSGLAFWWFLGRPEPDLAVGMHDLARIALGSIMAGLQEYATPVVVQLVAGGGLAAAAGTAVGLFSRQTSRA